MTIGENDENLDFQAMDSMAKMALCVKQTCIYVPFPLALQAFSEYADKPFREELWKTPSH